MHQHTTHTDVEEITREVGDILHSFQNLPSLTPSSEIDTLFAQLLHLVEHVPKETSIAAAEELGETISVLRSYTSAATSLFEKKWSERIAGTATKEEAEQVLAEFPFLKNYYSVVHTEYEHIKNAGAHAGPLVLIGSGPLPISLTLFKNEGANPIIGVDRDRDAIVTSRALLEKLGIGEGTIRIVETEAEQYEEIAGASAVIVAALVGDTSEQKEAVIRALVSKVRPGTVFVLRAAEGLKTLFYPAIDVSRFTDLELVESVTDPKFLSTLYILKKKIA